MFSHTTEYALRAMVILSSDREKVWTNTELAGLSKVPSDYLAKVLQLLSRSELIHGSRGAKGGYRLVKDPEKITILEVVQAVDPIERIKKCPLGIKSHGTNLCPLHRRLDDAAAAIETEFGKASLMELVEQGMLPGASKPCDFPTPPSSES